MIENEEAQAALGLRIWRQSRQELYLSMRFLDLALSSFRFVPDVRTFFAGTDGSQIGYRFEYVAGLFQENPILLNRLYLHMVLHCIYRHLFRRGNREKELWNLSCDIAVESVIDGLGLPVVTVRGQDRRRIGLRQELYGQLGEAMGVLTAEGIYRYLQKKQLPERTLDVLAEEFLVDDHSFWQNVPPKQQAETEQKWNNLSQKTQTSMETFSKEQSEEQGAMLQTMQVANRAKCSYQDFLRRFAVLREEVQVDPDSFDPIFYTFGLEMYGNLPLVEPQEFKEVRRIEEFVIAIDTSQSTNGALVQGFLEQTYAILREQETFSRKMHIRILQCDTKVQSDVKITSEEELKEYMDHFTLKGGGGTDFRPVFSYVEQLRAQGELRDLKGLLYFTDGEGEYPKRRTEYETAFLFLKETDPGAQFPPWALRLVIPEEEQDMWEQQGEQDHEH